MLRLDFTKEEKLELDILTQEYQNIANSLKTPKTILETLYIYKNNIPMGEKKDLDALDNIIDKALALRKKALERTLQYYSTNLDELEKDIKEQIRFNIHATYFLLSENEAIWKKNILVSINEYTDLLKKISPERYEELEKFIEDIFKNKDTFAPKINLNEKIKSEIGENNSELGLYTANPLSIMFSGKATNTLGKLKTIGKIDNIKKTANVSGVKIISQNISQMGVGEAKIFRYALAAFTQKNSTGTERQKINLRMFLSFNDYAKATNTDISTEDRKKNFKKKLKKNLENLMEKHISFSWTEDIRGKIRNYGGLSLISGYKINNEAITVDFSLGFAEYLVSLPTLVEYPRALYGVNDRNYNAFAIGEAMFQHYSINNNIIKGTEQILSVQKILEVTSFPTYEKVKEEKHSWEYKIKEQLEKALDHLYECGFLKDWYYSYAKGKKLTDKEASQITSYEKFASLYVWYEINDYPDHKERADLIIEAKAEKLKKIIKKRSHKKG